MKTDTELNDLPDDLRLVPAATTPATPYARLLTHPAVAAKTKAALRAQRAQLNPFVVIAEGETNWVFVNAKTGRPQSIPTTVSAAFELVP